MALNALTELAASELTQALGPYVYRTSEGNIRAQDIARAVVAGRLRWLVAGEGYVVCPRDEDTYRVGTEGENTLEVRVLAGYMRRLRTASTLMCTEGCEARYGSAACAACPAFQVPHV